MAYDPTEEPVDSELDTESTPAGNAQSLIEGDPQEGEDGQSASLPSPLHPAYQAPAQSMPAQPEPKAAPVSNGASVSGLKPGVSQKREMDALNNSPILADERKASASLAPLHPAASTAAAGPVAKGGGYDADLKPFVPNQIAQKPQPNPELAGIDPKEVNSQRIAKYKTEGVQYYTDPVTKMVTPVTNEDGSVRFHAKTGPVQYDANGKAIQEQQDERGNRTPVYPDANAEIGAHPDTPNDIYRQNKLSSWDYIGKAHELVDHADPKIAAAAQAATIKSEQEIHKIGSQAFGKHIFDSNQAIQAKTAEIRSGNQKYAALSNELDSTLNNPKFNEKQTVQGAGIFGQIGGTDSLHTAEASHLQAHALGLQGQLAELQKNGISGDVNTDLANKEIFGPLKKAYGEAVQARVGWQAGKPQSVGDLDGLAEARRNLIETAGGDPSKDPVLLAIGKKREELGMQDAHDDPVAKHAEEIQAKRDAETIKSNPDYAPLISERNAIQLEAKSAKTPEEQQAVNAKIETLNAKFQDVQDAQDSKNPTFATLIAERKQIEAEMKSADTTEAADIANAKMQDWKARHGNAVADIQARQANVKTAIQAAKDGKKPYTIDEKGLGFDPKTPLKSIRAAELDGILTSEQAKAMAPKAAKAQQAWAEMMTVAENNPKLIASLDGFSRGASAAAAGFAATAALEGQNLSISAATGPWAPLTMGALNVVEFMVAAGIEGKVRDKIQSGLAKYTQSFKDLEEARKAAPEASQYGELAGGMLIPGASSVRNLAKMGAGQAVRAIGGGAIGGAGAELIRPGIDYVGGKAADAFGISHDPVQAPTLKSVGESAAMGALLGGLGANEGKEGTPKANATESGPKGLGGPNGPNGSESPQGGLPGPKAQGAAPRDPKAPRGPAAPKRFASEQEFRDFMDNAAKNGDAENARNAWTTANTQGEKRWFSRWNKEVSNGTDVDAQDFANSILNGHSNEQHDANAAEQRSRREGKTNTGTPGASEGNNSSNSGRTGTSGSHSQESSQGTHTPEPNRGGIARSETGSELAGHEAKQVASPAESIKPIVPSANAAALGAISTAQHQQQVGDLDQRISDAKVSLGAAQSAKDPVAIKAHSEELNQLHTERQGLVAEAQHNERLNAASDAIDAIKTGDQQTDSDTQDAARALIKIASGKTLDHLTANEQAALNTPTVDGLPRVSKVGKTPVITQGTIDRLRQLAPAAADFIESTHGTEESRRAASIPQELAPVEPAKTEKPKKEKTVSSKNRAPVLSKLLQANHGAPVELADKFVAGFLSEPANAKLTYTEQRAAIAERYQSALSEHGGDHNALAAKMQGEKVKSEVASHVEGKTPQDDNALAKPTLAESKHYLFDSKPGDIAPMPNGGNRMILNHFNKLKDASAAAKKLNDVSPGIAKVEAWLSKAKKEGGKPVRKYTVYLDNVSEGFADQINQLNKQEQKSNEQPKAVSEKPEPAAAQSSSGSVDGASGENAPQASDGIKGEIERNREKVEASGITLSEINDPGKWFFLMYKDGTLTINHAQYEQWMKHAEPGQRGAFFDSLVQEEVTHHNIAEKIQDEGGVVDDAYFAAYDGLTDKQREDLNAGYTVNEPKDLSPEAKKQFEYKKAIALGAEYLRVQEMLKMGQKLPESFYSAEKEARLIAAVKGEEKTEPEKDGNQPEPNQPEIQAQSERGPPEAKPAKTETEEAVDKLFEGLFAQAPKQEQEPLKQIGFPADRMELAQKAAAALVKDGVNTPQGLANWLESRYQGKARSYSQSLWNALSSIDPDLTGRHDWHSIYNPPSETPEAANQPTATASDPSGDQAGQPTPPAQLAASSETPIEVTRRHIATLESRMEQDKRRGISRNDDVERLAELKANLSEQEKVNLPAVTEAPAPIAEATENVVAQAEKVETAKKPASTAPKVLKAQREYLLSALDQAIKEAPDVANYGKVPADDDLSLLDKINVVKEKESVQSHFDRKARTLKKLYAAYGIPEIKPEWTAAKDIDGNPMQLGLNHATHTDERPYTEDERINQLKSKILEARKNQRGYVRIEIPGDGTFTIENSKDTLEQFRRDASKRFPVSVPKGSEPKFSPQNPKMLPALGSPKSAGDFIKIAALATSDDKGREILHYVFSNGEQIVATDGRRLVAIDAEAGGTLSDPLHYKEGSAKPASDVGTYPNWKQVIPNPQDLDKAATIDTGELFKLATQAKLSTQEEVPRATLWVDNKGKIGITLQDPNTGEYAGGDLDHNKAKLISTFDADLLLDLTKIARGLGHDKVTWNIGRGDAYNKPSVFEAAGMKYIMMPIRSLNGDGNGTYEASNPKHPLASSNQPEIDNSSATSIAPIDKAAHEAATSPSNEKPVPTEAQAKAGNYEKGHVTISGLDISIENPEGSKRRPEWPTLNSHYGYIKGTVGKDKDHVDVFIKPGTPESYDGTVFVVNQLGENGKLDEHKAVIGVATKSEAEALYRGNYSGVKHELVKSIATMPMEDFKKWAYEAANKNRHALSTVKKPSEPAGEKTGIQDFGEKIHGAKKDLWSSYKKAMGEELPIDGSEITLSKNFPEPDYELAISQGVPVESLATFKALRDLIPPKPRNSWKLSRWVETVSTMHKLMQQLATGNLAVTPERIEELVKQTGSHKIRSRVRFYQKLGYPAFTGAKDWNVETWSSFSSQGGTQEKPVPITIATNKGRMDRSTEVLGQDQSAHDRVVHMVRFRIEEEQNAPASKKETKFGIWSDRFTKDVFIGKEASSGVIRLKTGFKTAKEARQHLEDNREALEKQWEAMKAPPAMRRAANNPRQGISRRPGDMSPEQFQETFGFRGVQFGNWVEGERRQADLNESFDALVDMAEALGIPAKALSLDGSLGLAFGARGGGGVDAPKAHYEPGEVVINLTKRIGPGSLAHEWFHGLDNYFARLEHTGSTAAASLDKFATNATGDPKNVRPEVWSAFQKIQDTLSTGTFAERSKQLDETRSKPYYGTTIEKAARAFERYVVDRLAGSNISNDYLVNIIKDGSPAYPTNEEMEGGIREVFDNLFNILDTKETKKGTALYAQNPAREFAEQDVKPAVKGIAEGIGETYRGIVHTLAPRVGVSREALDTMGEMRGERDRAMYELERLTKPTDTMFSKLGEQASVDFIDNIKLGKPQATPELQAIADFYRQWEDERHAEKIKFNPSAAYLEDHYRVMWKVIPGSNDARQGIVDRFNKLSKPEQADFRAKFAAGAAQATPEMQKMAEQMTATKIDPDWKNPGGGIKGFFGVGRRPVEGDKGWMKQHTLADMSEGLKIGGVPASYNPNMMFRMNDASQMKWITAQRMWQNFKDLGLRKFVRHGGRHPEGWTQIDDRIANIWFKGDQGAVHAGDWYVEPNAARLLNNHLSRDLIRETKLGSGLMFIKNATTAAELSFSPFHAIFESGEAVSSMIGVGLSKIINLGIMRGDSKAFIAGIKDVLKSPAAPYTIASVGSGAVRSFDEGFWRSDDGKWLEKQFPGKDVRQMIVDGFNGGLKPTQHEDYQITTAQTFIANANSGNYIGATLRAIPALNQLVTHPLFNIYIPRLKWGIFLKQYSHSLEVHSKDIASGKMTRTELARKTVDFVEDRFGEMNFDNLYWNRTFKTAMQFMFRSVTWKLGSLRAFGSIIPEMGAEFARAAKERRAPVISPKATWAMGVFILSAAIAEVLSAIFKTPTPKTLQDVMFPRVDPNDQNIRVSSPTYLKDVYHLVHAPVSYVSVSSSSILNRVLELKNNKDYYGTKLYNEDDSATEQAIDIAKFGAGTLLPFSIRGYKRFADEDLSMGRKLLAAAAFNPAPKSVTNTEAGKLLDHYSEQAAEARGARTKEQAEKGKAQSNLVRQARGGDMKPTLDAVRSGAITHKDAMNVQRKAMETPMQSRAKYLTMPQSLKLWEVANPKEREELRPVFQKKNLSEFTSKSISEAEFKANKQKFAGLIQKPETPVLQRKVAIPKAPVKTNAPDLKKVMWD